MESVLSWLETSLIIGGIGFLIIRRFFWRLADPARLLRFPMYIIGTGLVWTVWEVAKGEQVTLLAVGIACVEIALVSLTGVAMGLMTQIRKRNGVLSYRLAPYGLVLWGAFIAIRIGSFVVAGRIGAPLLETESAIMVSFGINRLASSVVVKRRIERRDYESEGR